MSPPRITTHAQQELIESLTQLVRERERSNRQIDNSFGSRQLTTETQFATDSEHLTAQYEQDLEQAESGYRQQSTEIHQRCESESHQLAYQQAEFAERARAECQAAIAAAQSDWKTACRQAQQTFDHEKSGPERRFAEFQQQCVERWRELVTRRESLGIALRRQGSEVEDIPAAFQGEVRGQPLDSYAAAARRADDAYLRAQRPLFARMSEWPGLVVVQLLVMTILFFAVATIAGPERTATGEDRWMVVWITLACCLLGVGTAWLYRILLMPLARLQLMRRYPDFGQACADARASLDVAIAHMETQRNRHIGASETRRDRDLKAAEAIRSQREKHVNDEYQQVTQTTASKFRSRRQSAEETRDRDLEALRHEHPRQLARLEQTFTAASNRLQQRKSSRLSASQNVYEEKLRDLQARWRTGADAFMSAVDAMNTFCSDHFLPWSEIDWTSWQPPLETVTAIRFGSYHFSLKREDGGPPTNPPMVSDRTEFSIPAVISFPDCPSLLLKTPGAGRDRAAHTLQNVMLRLLTCMPAGKVRYTIIDPLGLGQTFSAFMHLADYDERLVTNRIWTEAAHINQRLTDLTEHMENVIQTYLRNEFESIQDYNRHAGEVAEPFHVLVIANFPANFNEETARRLVSIATSGARCGVYTLMCVDTSMKLPRNFSLSELERQAATLQWDGQDFYWDDPLLSQLPLKLDLPPPDNDFTAAVKTVGGFARHANRVEVPFATVVAEDGAWWKQDSRHGLEVALGRSGATKLQTMQLGHGTSQHVLIAGKTGSGKSTLMHALITNLSISYAPQEVAFYLVDFKKGVEFKPYATWALPHARVIAIESEREFGLSVLERLDEELKHRGTLFREQGVQDVAGFRNVCPTETLPRILLMIDEFQELFVVDDKIASQASLLLDRLVRQGRAFGIHVLLGSQTLAGAYSLARSTLGQMAVRIALQCSEADSHLILSEENTAARLLGRPGEAIYNDANGLFEGNHPFQIVWLPDHEREKYLQQIGELAQLRGLDGAGPVVFEGNIPADASQNLCLQAALESPPGDPSLAGQTWLGAAVAIKDPTSIRFIRGGGSNLLLVGQHKKLALGTLATALVGLLATRSGPSGIEPQSTFYVLDGTPPGETHSGFWQRFGAQLPIDSRIVSPRQTAETLDELDRLVKRRLTEPNARAAPTYVILFDLARFRELRKDESYSFSSFDEDDSPQTSKQFAHLLREGPPQGVHCLIWSDTFNNAQRWLDRQNLRDIEMRVLFPMSPSDSSALMDSPAAAQLGANRAIFYSEQTGVAEKFRPYSIPEEDWLTRVTQRLGNATNSSAPG